MTDPQIVQLFWDRDERAIPETAKKYGAYCTAIAKNILISREDAEECVNDTYLKAWNAMPPTKPRLLSAFLAKIVRGLSLNRYRHDTAEKRGYGQVSLVLDELSDCISDSDTVEQTIDRKELLGAIGGFLAGLPRDKRSIFICRYWYFDSVSDIAMRFSISENSVSVTLHRLRVKLHSYLLERGFDL